MQKRYKFPHQVISEILKLVTRAGVCFPSLQVCSNADSEWTIGGIKFAPSIKRTEDNFIEASPKQNARILIEALKLEMEKRAAIPAYRKIREEQDINPLN